MSRSLFKNRRIITSLPIMLVAALMIPSYAVPFGHSQFTGLVCITSPATSTSCPTMPASIGPVTVGQNFTVGLFVQGSDAMGGWDIYVKTDPSLVNPVGASLGTLVANPSLTSICINGAAVTGSCTVGTANGPGVVEATTIESSGGNECGGISPCSGLALTVTYHVVGSFSSTSLTYPTAAGCSTSSVSSPLDVCVLIADNTGNALPENIQGATVTQPPPKLDPTATAVACTVPVVIGETATCTGTVSDTASSGATLPTGSVQFVTGVAGSFNPNPCTLSMATSTVSNCVTTFTPAAVGSVTFAAVYSGDSTHAISSFNMTLIVGKATPTISTAVSSANIPVGGSISDQASLSGGYPSTGVSGLVVYSLFSNGACTAPNTGTSNVTVGTGNIVPLSATFTLNTAGSYSFNAFYAGDINNNAVTSACEPFTVSGVPSFTGGKLHWTHHLSLSKSNSAQTWTAIIVNPMPVLVSVVVRIMGSSLINPSLNFDVTCGAVCVNTNGNVNTAAVAAGRVFIAPGGSFSPTFSQQIDSSLANTKITFTATLYWATGTLYSPSSTKSGAFAVVP